MSNISLKEIKDSKKRKFLSEHNRLDLKNKTISELKELSESDMLYLLNTRWNLGALEHAGIIDMTLRYYRPAQWSELTLDYSFIFFNSLKYRVKYINHPSPDAKFLKVSFRSWGDVRIALVYYENNR